MALGTEILKLVRDRGVVRENDLTDLLSARGSRALYALSHWVESLIAADLIVRAGSTLQITERWGKVRQALDLSLTELMDLQDHSAAIVRPLFGRADPHKAAIPAPDIFVLMPFRPDLQPVFEDHIRKTAGVLHLSVQRADDLAGSRDIMQDVWQGICNSRLVIADCTGRNPNVFYEIGISHTVGTPVLLITQHAEDIPFDLRSIRYIAYEYTPRGMAAFEGELGAFIESMIAAK